MSNKRAKIYLNIILNWFKTYHTSTQEQRVFLLSQSFGVAKEIVQFARWTAYLTATRCQSQFRCEKKQYKKAREVLSVEIMKNALLYFLISMVTVLVEKVQFIESDFMTTKRSWIHNPGRKLAALG